MQELPYPPNCAHCGGLVGMWERVLIEPDATSEPTTWLRLCDEDQQPDSLWHEACIRAAATA